MLYLSYLDENRGIFPDFFELGLLVCGASSHDVDVGILEILEIYGCLSLSIAVYGCLWLPMAQAEREVVRTLELPPFAQTRAGQYPLRQEP